MADLIRTLIEASISSCAIDFPYKRRAFCFTLQVRDQGEYGGFLACDAGNVGGEENARMIVERVAGRERLRDGDIEHGISQLP